MKNLIILTSSFPYEGGEQFLETEIEYWKNSLFDNIYIIPASCQGKLRKYPDNIKVVEIKNNKSKIYYILLSLCNSVFQKEVFYIIIKRNKCNFFNNVKSALHTTALTLRARDNLDISLKSVAKGENTVYSYWNDASFYAACLLKKECLIKKVTSRAHGFDIYEERRPHSYMPLKRQFKNDFDKIYLLSKGALEYYNDIYGADKRNLEVARLGVNIQIAEPMAVRQDNIVNIVSLSYCVPVKQIHKITAAVHRYAQLNQDLSVKWTHIGGGPLYDELNIAANQIDATQKNLEIDFIGHVSNFAVKQLFEKNYYDVFVNTSQSEGIPVSIMEAMSYEIPSIAPEVGGIADLVNDSNGYLMPNNFNIDDIVKGIDKLRKNEEYKSYRKNARNWVKDNFNSINNYPAFVNEIEKIAGIYDSK